MPTEPGFVTRFYLERGFRVTSPFGPRPDPFDPTKSDYHTGIDYGGMPRGTPVESPTSGVVVEARRFTGWGNLVAEIDDREFIHLFAHLDQFRVAKGDRIARGDVVGTIGSTGNATGPHLHYQINRPGTWVNGSGYFGNPDDYIFDYEVTSMQRAIVLGSDADYCNAAPLRDRLNCPIFYRSALGSLRAAETVYICGGPEVDVVEAAPSSKIVNLSGVNRYETAAKIREFLNR